ncbi:MAG: hypothetical protein ACJ8JD_05395, partial [Chthoniobacterales bacterium]
LNSTATLNGFDGISANGGSINNCAALGNAANGIDGTNTAVMNSMGVENGSNGIAVGFGAVSFCTATLNNLRADGSVDIRADSSARTGNLPAP